MTALGDHTVLLPKGIASLVGAPGFGQDPLFVVGMENLYPELRVLQPLLGSVAEHPLYLWAHVDGGADLVYRVYVGDRRYLFHQGAVALFGLPELILGLLTLGDIPRGDHHAPHVRVVEQVDAHALHPPPGAVGVAEAVLGSVRG